MAAVHWLRSRQEERELIYWLSFVAYDHRDRSLNNRIYLLYLLLFFSVWVFAVLAFFASGGAVFLRVVNSNNPIGAAVFLQVLLLSVWSVFTLWQSLKRSPVVFSEQDALLICQMPVNHRHVTLRWLVMPWLKSAVPFWLAAITIGFSVAEISMPGVMGANRIFEYAEYGLRAWLAIIPVHLALFSLQWVVGIYRLQKDLERNWLPWPVLAISLAFISFLLMVASDATLPLFVPLETAARFIIFPLQVGFGYGSLSVSLGMSGCFAAAMLGIMYWVSGGFSLSRAAQETQEVERYNSALRYGFTSYAQELKTQRRLGIKRPPSRLPTLVGSAVLIWKDLLQSQRSFRVSSVFNWFSILSIMISLPFLPDLNSRILAIAVWVIQVGKVSVIRLRSDLSCWSLVRQLPISHKNLLLFDLCLAYLLTVVMSLGGLGIYAIFSGTPVDTMVVMIPGMVAGVAGMANFDVIRQSRSSLLFNGSVPEISAAGVLLGLLAAFIPILIRASQPGPAGFVLSFFTSLLPGGLAYYMALRSYRRIGNR